MESSNNNDFYILLVDDEKDILDLFSEYLTSNGFNTISFDNPVNALKYFYQNPNNCSLVITDYKMKQMSGIDWIKKIHASSLFFVLLTKFRITLFASSIPL